MKWAVRTDTRMRTQKGGKSGMLPAIWLSRNLDDLSVADFYSSLMGGLVSLGIDAP